ncbi:hypothetical protein PCH_Pc20g05540 [Penicillium rubens Wisconsin 54-1255]|uniref:Uncharacterized protein n=1 Tax=Penicillium rubens (strain ATCC 28089 / DSM 1075 / NRRL 1951 / Wisconsin 54-1255) TaxID=500485 RepID=B6HF65_PENRW|nr:hypothetical protein PCH_Pc20g05540 [Penicillium rubens Wisconsin 54-1255]
MPQAPSNQTQPCLNSSPGDDYGKTIQDNPCYLTIKDPSTAVENLRRSRSQLQLQGCMVQLRMGIRSGFEKSPCSRNTPRRVPKSLIAECGLSHSTFLITDYPQPTINFPQGQ